MAFRFLGCRSHFFKLGLRGLGLGGLRVDMCRVLQWSFDFA